MLSCLSDFVQQNVFCNKLADLSDITCKCGYNNHYMSFV